MEIGRLDVTDFDAVPVAIADVVETGTTLRAAGMEVFGEAILESEAVLIRGDRPSPAALEILDRRIEGVLVARQYVMIDYDCPRSLLEQATAITPGLESPTVAPMADPEWAAVRAMVPRRDHQNLMDELSELGARAILASDIRSCRF